MVTSDLASNDQVAEEKTNLQPTSGEGFNNSSVHDKSAKINAKTS